MDARLVSRQDEKSSEFSFLENIYRFYSLISVPSARLRVLKNNYIQFLKKCFYASDTVTPNSPVFLKVLARRIEFLRETGFFEDKMPAAALDEIIEDLKNDGSILKSQFSGEDDYEYFLNSILTIDITDTPLHSACILVPSNLNTDDTTCRSKFKSAEVVCFGDEIWLPSIAYLSELLGKGLDAMLMQHWESAINYFKEGLSAIQALNPPTKHQLNAKAAEICRHLATVYNNAGLSHLMNHNFHAAMHDSYRSVKTLNSIVANQQVLDDHENIKRYKTDYIKIVNLYSDELTSKNEHKKALIVLMKAAKKINFEEYAACPHEVELIKNLIQTVFRYTKQMIALENYELTIPVLHHALQINATLNKYFPAEACKQAEMKLRKLLIQNYYFLGKKHFVSHPETSILFFSFALTEYHLIDENSLNTAFKKFQKAIAEIVISRFANQVLDKAYTWLMNFLKTPRSAKVCEDIGHILIKILINQADFYKKEDNVDKALEKLSAAIDICKRFEGASKDIHATANINRFISELTYLEILRARVDNVISMQYCLRGMLALSAIPTEILNDRDNVLMRMLRFSHSLYFRRYLNSSVENKDFKNFIETIKKQMPTADIVVEASYIRSLVCVSVLQAHEYSLHDQFSKAMQSLLYAEKTWKQIPPSTFIQTDLVTSATINRSIAKCLLNQFKSIHKNILHDTLLSKVSFLLKASSRFEEISSALITDEDKDTCAIICSVLSKLQIQIELKLCNSIEALFKLRGQLDTGQINASWKINFDAEVATSLNKITEDMSNENQVIAILLMKQFLTSNANYPYKEQMKLCLSYIEYNLTITQHLDAQAERQYAPVRRVSI